MMGPTPKRQRLQIKLPSGWAILLILTLPTLGCVLFRLITHLRDN
jgi:hypothetical protein